MKLVWPAPERNKEPILEVLRRVLPPTGRVLEIASGTGQHIAYFAEMLPDLTFVPSDFDDANLASIAEYVAESRYENLLAPIRLDVCELDYGVGELDAMICSNLIHIAPWECALGLVRGAARHLRIGGRLVIYGPFRIAGAHTSESNAEFDRDLRRRDDRWGVRDLEALVTAANEVGIELDERVAMPANNQTLVFTLRNRA